MQEISTQIADARKGSGGSAVEFAGKRPGQAQESGYGGKEGYQIDASGTVAGGDGGKGGEGLSDGTAVTVDACYAGAEL